MLNKTALALLGTTAIAISASPATAVTMRVDGGKELLGEGFVSIEEDAYRVDFNDGTANDPNGFVTYSNITTNIVQGSRRGQYATPYQNTSKYLTIAPSNQNVAGNTGFVNLDFAEAIDYFGFYAGSLDNYNFIDIYYGDQLLNTFSGSDVPGAIANGSWTSTESNMFINLIGEEGEKFDRVVMRSNGVAFETDNHTYRLADRNPTRVPEPSSILGFLAIGACCMGSVFKKLENKVVVK